MNDRDGANRTVSAVAKTDSALPLLSDGHVMVITGGYTNVGLGAPTVMRNLLAQFAPDSYCVATQLLYRWPTIELSRNQQVYCLPRTPDKLPARVARRIERFYPPLGMVKIRRLITRTRPSVIVGVYPDGGSLQAACEVARSTQTPWIAYIHDAIVENFAHTPKAEWARILQKRTFDEASALLVTGVGLRDLLQSRYGVNATPLQIGYPEPIPSELPGDQVEPQAFIGGNIYSVNANCIRRVVTATSKAECPLLLATAQSWKSLNSQGITEQQARKELFQERTEYLRALRRQGVLVVTMDWPDETPDNEDEIGTAFPTRAVEYLASGRPILVHCPEHYYLARFFRENKCGVVVSERSVDALASAIRFLLGDSEEVTQIRRAALQTARDVYSMNRLAKIFHDEIEAVSKLKWGEKLR